MANKDRNKIYCIWIKLFEYIIYPKGLSKEYLPIEQYSRYKYFTLKFYKSIFYYNMLLFITTYVVCSSHFCVIIKDNYDSQKKYIKMKIKIKCL